MKNYKNIFRLTSIVLGLFGVALMSSSCSKEKDCVCSYTYEGQSMEVLKVTTSDKCEDLEFSYDGESYDDISCKEK